MAEIGHPKRDVTVTPEREPVPEPITVPDYPPAPKREDVPV